MAKYFKNIKDFEDLKNQFKMLARKNHPDAGGNSDTMKEINCEYDALFPIWKDRHNATVSEEDKTQETAESTRRWFYTENGWEGSRYDSSLTTKDIAARVRAYVKEKYPTCKFSVRASSNKLTVDLKEFSGKMYKTSEDLKKEGLTEHIKTTAYDGEAIEFDKYKKEIEEMIRELRRNDLFNLDCWHDEDLIAVYDKAVEKNPRYAIKTEYFKNVIDDVEEFTKSYNYDDSDGMIDYFDTNFYFFGVGIDECKQVEKTTKNKETQPRQTRKPTSKQEKAPEINQKTKYTYKITQGEDTRDGSILWIVRIKETLDKAAYIAENNRMKYLGGYYSKFKHGFIFRFDPTEKLSA